MKIDNLQGSRQNYAVCQDRQGVGYLLVETTAKGSRYVTNTGKAVDLVFIDLATIRSRAIQNVPGSILDAAKVLYKPIGEDVVLSSRAEVELTKIMKDKEILAMATKTAKKAVTTSTSTTKAKGNGKVKVSRETADGTAKIKLLVKENPKREGSSSYKRFALYSKSATVADFLKAGGTRADLAWDKSRKFISVS